MFHSDTGFVMSESQKVVYFKLIECGCCSSFARIVAMEKNSQSWKEIFTKFLKERGIDVDDRFVKRIIDIHVIVVEQIFQRGVNF